jgi:hypothetical protein
MRRWAGDQGFSSVLFANFGKVTNQSNCIEAPPDKQISSISATISQVCTILQIMRIGCGCILVLNWVFHGGCT